MAIHIQYLMQDRSYRTCLSNTRSLCMSGCLGQYFWCHYLSWKLNVNVENRLHMPELTFCSDWNWCYSRYARRLNTPFYLRTSTRLTSVTKKPKPICMMINDSSVNRHHVHENMLIYCLQHVQMVLVCLQGWCHCFFYNTESIMTKSDKV